MHEWIEDLVASLYRIAIGSVLVFIVLVGLYSCAADMILCASYEVIPRLYTPEECK